MSSGPDKKKVSYQVEQLFCAEDVRLRRYLQLSGADRATAEDIAQDAFLATYRKMTRDGPMGCSRARQYLYKVASYNLWRHRRRDRLRQFGESLAQAREPQYAQDDTGELVGDEELRACLAVLATLAPRQREAFLLRYLAGLFPVAIADVMQIEVTAVNTHLGRARAKVAEHKGREAS